MTLDELQSEYEKVLARRTSLVSRVSIGERSVQYDLAQADRVLADLERRIAVLEGTKTRRRILVSASKGL